MDKNKLKAKIVMNGDTQEDLAKAMKLSLSNLSLRINGHMDFRQSEINFIRDRYKLTPDEVVSIFFMRCVSNLDT